MIVAPETQGLQTLEQTHAGCILNLAVLLAGLEPTEAAGVLE